MNPSDILIWIGGVLWLFCFITLNVVGIKNCERKHGWYFASKGLSSKDLKILAVSGLAFLFGFALFVVGVFAFSPA